MPKPNKTILDRLNKILKTRQDALNRFDRRASNLAHGTPWRNENHMGKVADSFLDALDAKDESQRLIDDLEAAAGIEYDRIIRSKPGKRIEREAIRMMPDHLIRDNGWY